MKNNYVIINSDTIQKRIDELENERNGFILDPDKTSEA